MHSRLLPLNPPQDNHTIATPRLSVPPFAMPSMPWLELGFFAVMILGLISVGA